MGDSVFVDTDSECQFLKLNLTIFWTILCNMVLVLVITYWKIEFEDLNSNGGYTKYQK